MPLENRIDKILFHSKHWQLFLIFLAACALQTFVMKVPVVTLFIVVIYLPVLGFRLRKYLPASYSLAYNIFLIASVVDAVSFVYILGFMPPTGTFWVNLTAAALFISYVTVLSFVARAIKSLETHDRATVNDYFVDIILLMVFFPIGMWFLQPRLNLLGDQFYR